MWYAHFPSFFCCDEEEVMFLLQVTDEEAVMVIRHMDNSRAMAQTLVDLAMAKGTTDNVTVMVVKLQKRRATE